MLIGRIRLDAFQGGIPMAPIALKADTEAPELFQARVRVPIFGVQIRFNGFGRISGKNSGAADGLARTA